MSINTSSQHKGVCLCEERSDVAISRPQPLILSLSKNPKTRSVETLASKERSSGMVSPFYRFLNKIALPAPNKSKTITVHHAGYLAIEEKIVMSPITPNIYPDSRANILSFAVPFFSCSVKLWNTSATAPVNIVTPMATMATKSSSDGIFVAAFLHGRPFTRPCPVSTIIPLVFLCLALSTEWGV